MTCVAQVSASDGSDLWNQLAKVRHPAHPCSGRSSQEYNQPSRMLRQESTDDSLQQGYKHKLYHVVPMIYLRSYIVGADKADPHLGRALDPSLPPRHSPRPNQRVTLLKWESGVSLEGTSRISPWTRKQVMSAADANIEVCGGTFVQMQSDNGGTNEEARLARLDE